MRAIAENRIADVIEMRRLDVIQEQAVLKLARISQHTAFTDDDVASNVRSRPDFSFRADVNGANNRRKRGQFNCWVNPNAALEMHARWNFQLIRTKFSRRQGRAYLLQPVPWGRVGGKKRSKPGQRRR